MELKAIDRISATEEAFRPYYEQQIPSVFTDFTAQWKMRDWDYDFLEQVAGNDLVKVYSNAYKNGQALDVQTKEDLEIPFRDFLVYLRENKPSEYRLFLFDIFKEHPELIEHIEQPSVGVHFLNYRFCFFGGPESATRMHYDIDYSNVFLSQFLGRKDILLFDRSQGENLYQIPLTTHSLIDFSRLEEYQEEDYPNLQQLKGYKLSLYPGETLFMPSGYWHYIAYPESSFSVALRSMSSKWIDVLHGANNVFVNRNIQRAISFSPRMKRMMDDYKKQLIRKRYENIPIEF